MTIVLAAIGFGAAGEALRRYRLFKQSRWRRPKTARNAGFWTDTRVAHAELGFAAFAAAIPFSAAVPLIAADRPVWVYYPLLLAYAGLIYLLVSSLNMAPPSNPE